MKKTILLLTLAFACVATNASAQNRHREQMPQTANAQCERCGNLHHHHHRQPSYMVINNKVFFDGHIVAGASAANFKVLNNGYAKDAWAVCIIGERKSTEQKATPSTI